MKNKQLFLGTAQYYAKYRAGYPIEFFEYIIKYFDLNQKGRLLDLGCGTGQLALPLTKYFQEITALDCESEMLNEAKNQARNRRIENITFVLQKAEEITDSLGLFRLVVMGASFHWMNQSEVLEKVYDITEDGGGVVIVSDSSSPWQVIQEPWKEVRKKIVQKYLGKKRRAGNTFYNEPKERFETLLRASLFKDCKEWKYSYIKNWSLEEAINFLYSTSFASRRLFGNKLNDFEKELMIELLKLEPSGVFQENIHLQVLLAQK